MAQTMAPTPGQMLGDAPQTLTSGLVVVDNFLPQRLADAMRADIDAHFAHPGAHKPETHQVWNYWFVPGLYAYLRTQPEKLIERERARSFFNALGAWSARYLGFGRVTWPFLSLYLPGCRQGVHNDAKNGRFAYVYSLTKDDRKTVGGETLVVREGDLFRDNVDISSAGPGFQTAIEPRFNRLIIFDDRLPHGVERLDGPMDPGEGRFVLHGHISDSGPLIAGPLSVEEAQPVLVSALAATIETSFARMRLYHGPLTLRLEVGADGKVMRCAPLLDRVTAPQRGDAEWPRLRAQIVDRFAALQFPEASGPSLILQPIIFEASLYRPKL
jgi:hypothetical protein